MINTAKNFTWLNKACRLNSHHWFEKIAECLKLKKMFLSKTKFHPAKLRMEPSSDFFFIGSFLFCALAL